MLATFELNRRTLIEVVGLVSEFIQGQSASLPTEQTTRQIVLSCIYVRLSTQ